MKAGKQQDESSARIAFWSRWPWLVLLLSLTLAIAVARNAAIDHFAREKARFDFESQEECVEIKSTFKTYVTLIDSVRGLASIQDSISQKEFRTYTDQLALQTNYHGIQALGIALRVNPNMRSDWRSLLDEAVREQFKIWPRSDEIETCPIIYAEPLELQNQASLGFDIFTDPTRRKAAVKAIETGRPAATGKHALIQEKGTGKQAGFTIYMPVYVNNRLPSSIEERHAKFVCFIFCTFRGDVFSRIATQASSSSLLGVRVYDGTGVSREGLMNGSMHESEAAFETASFKATNSIMIADHLWTVVTYSRPEFMAMAPWNPAPYVLLGGFLTSALLFGLTMVQARAHRNAANYVVELEQVAETLRKKEATLARAQRIAHLGNWERNLESDELVWSDETYRIFGLEPQEIKPGYQDFLQRVHPEDRELVKKAAGDSLAAGRPYQVEHRIVLPDGRVRTVVEQAEVIGDENGKGKVFMGTVLDITERKTFEVAKAEAEAKFRRLVEQSLTGIYVIQDGRFVYVNPQMAAMFGATQEDLTSAPVMGFIHPDDRATALANIDRRLAGEVESIRYGLRMLRRDTSVMFAEVHGGLVDYEGRPAIMGTMLDVTERRKAEETLRESQARLQLATRASNIGYWDWNMKTGQVYFSPEWKGQLGYKEEEIAGHYSEWESRLHPDDIVRVKADLNGFLAGTRLEYSPEFRLRHKDGSYRWIYTRAEMIRNDDGQPERMIGCHVDLTEQKQVAEQLRQSQKMQAIGQLSGGVAHDFNNLLTIIQGHCQLIMLEPLSGPLADSMQEIAKAAERAANLTRQLLLFSRQQPMRRTGIDLGVVVTNAVKMLHRLIGENIRLVVEGDGGEMPLIEGDVGMIEQVLLNLVVNARDAMTDGGEIAIRTKMMQLGDNSVTGRKAGSYICLMVSDTGCGIPEKILPQIFDPFFTTKEAGKGTGLGLATVHGIMKQHDGWIEVDSTVGIGTTFTMGFPIKAQIKTTPVARNAGPARQGGNETILLVEDEPALRGLIKIALRRSGYNILEAANGVEALDLWQEKAEQINLLLTDMVMPGKMTGWQLYQELLASRSGLKAIIMSGYSRDTENEQWQEEFKGGFLQKPFTPDDLTRKVRACLDEVKKD